MKLSKELHPFAAEVDGLIPEHFVAMFEGDLAEESKSKTRTKKKKKKKKKSLSRLVLFLHEFHARRLVSTM